MKRKLFWILLLIAMGWFLHGCGTPRSMPLESRWLPLMEVREAAWVRAGWVTTFGGTVYVQDLDNFSGRYPFGSTYLEGLLLHEQVHSERMLRGCPLNPALWGARYLLSGSFRWEEERLGWAQEILYHRFHGAKMDHVRIATALSDPSYDMATFEQAKAWVDALDP